MLEKNTIFELVTFKNDLALEGTAFGRGIAAQTTNHEELQLISPRSVRLWRD